MEVGEKLWLNEDVGLAEAAAVLEAVAKEAERQGVRRVKMDVSKIIVEGGVCRGIKPDDGSYFTAKETIMAVGPWTLALLESSEIRLPDQIASNFFIVAAVGVALIDLDEEEYAKYKSMPIVVTKDGIFFILDPTRP